MIVKIDRSTFKPNPTAGNRRTFLEGFSRFTVEMQDGSHWTNIGSVNPKTREGLMVCLRDKAGNAGQQCELAELVKDGGIVTVVRNGQWIDHLPEEKWKYNYLPQDWPDDESEDIQFENPDDVARELGLI